jgi:hypothetical protein
VRARIPRRISVNAPAAFRMVMRTIPVDLDVGAAVAAVHALNCRNVCRDRRNGRQRSCLHCRKAEQAEAGACQHQQTGPGHWRTPSIAPHSPGSE